MHTHQHGFTLFELVMVIIIVSVLAAIAMPRWSLRDSTVHAQAAQIARDIRHVQMLAMSQGRTLTFQSLGNSYRCVDSGSVIITDPATQQPFNIALKNGVTLTIASVNFDSLGRPVTAATPNGSPITYRVPDVSPISTLTITPITGFVTVTP